MTSHNPDADGGGGLDASKGRIIQMDSLIALMRDWVEILDNAERVYQSVPPMTRAAIDRHGMGGTDELHLIAFFLEPEARRQTAEMIRQVTDALIAERETVAGNGDGFLTRFTGDDVKVIADFARLTLGLGSRSRRQLRFFLDSATQGDVAHALISTKGRRTEVRVMTKLDQQVVAAFGQE